MGKKTTKLQIKKRSEELRERRIAQALLEARRAERVADLGPKKRKEVEILRRYIALPPRSYLAIRDVDDYQAKKYAIGKQVLALIDHLFVRYPTPPFLYRSMLTPEGEKLVFGEIDPKGNGEYFRPWFLAIAQGRSFAQAAKGVLTKREAHEFLRAPGDLTARQAIVWAQGAAMGVRPQAILFLLDRFGVDRLEGYGPRREDLLRFYGAWYDQMRGDRIEIADFLRQAHENARFSLKGRTLGSVRKLTRQWHRTRYWGSYTVYRSWRPRYPDWEIRVGPFTVVAVELCDSDRLASEGLRQRHCVVTYARSCEVGLCRIVSMRWLGHQGAEFRRLTLEIRPSHQDIVQVKGNHNRWPDDDEMRIVRKWASAHGLSVAVY